MAQVFGLNGSIDASQSVLLFHTTRSKKVHLWMGRSQVRRQGIAFSARPVRPEETIFLRVTEAPLFSIKSLVWGNEKKFGIGFTSTDPASLSGSIPNAGSDLKDRPGFWLRDIVKEIYPTIVSFHYTTSGEVRLNIDGIDKGVFIEGIGNYSSLWVLIDVNRGIRVQFIDSKVAYSKLRSFSNQLEIVKELITGRLYRCWRDWLFASEDDDLYIWSDAAVLKFRSDSNGQFYFMLDGKFVTMNSSGTYEDDDSGSSVFLDRIHRMSTMNTSEPILPNGTIVTLVKLIFGKWSLLVKGKEMIIKNSDEQLMEIVLRQDLRGFVLKSNGGTRQILITNNERVSSLATRHTTATSNHSNALFSAWELSRNQQSQISSAPPALPAPAPTVAQDSPQTPTLRQYRSQVFRPLTFHPCIHSINIQMAPDSRTAKRIESFCNGYVMSSRPIVPGESCVVEIKQMDSDLFGGLGFGLTACNPASLSPNDFPDDAYELLDRHEFWVFFKDVVDKPLAGDKIEFHLSKSGEATIRRNGGDATQLMHVDVSLPLWTIFDVFGSTKEISLIDTIAQPQEQLVSEATADSACSNSGAQSISECTICYEKPIDCVLSSCGHMCACYDCATRLKNSTTQCPICRAKICDVIRVYHP